MAAVAGQFSLDKESMDRDVKCQNWGGQVQPEPRQQRLDSKERLQPEALDTLNILPFPINWKHSRAHHSTYSWVSSSSDL